MATKKGSQKKVNTDIPYDVYRGFQATLKTATDDRDALRTELNKVVVDWKNEQLVRECSERQCEILSEQMKDYTRIAVQISEIGDLLRTQYPEEIARGDHGGSQTLAQVLWRYLKVERQYRGMIEMLDRCNAFAPSQITGVSETQTLKPWLARLVRWFA